MIFDSDGHGIKYEHGDHIFIRDGVKQTCFGPRIYTGKRSTILVLSQYYGKIAAELKPYTFDAKELRKAKTYELVTTQPNWDESRPERILYRNLDLTTVIDYQNHSEIKAYFVCTEPPVML